MPSLEATRVLAGLLMHHHGLGHWKFGFDRCVRRAGVCNFTKKQITLSEHFAEMNSMERVKDTILHEIAHGLAGYEADHGPQWQAICAQIGAEPRSCYDPAVTTMPEGRYRAVCPCCDKLFTRHRMPKRKHYCAACGYNRGLLDFEEYLEG